MSSVFEPVKLGWQGKVYLLPANRVLGAVARIEEVITLAELAKHASGGNAPLARIARAYGSVLRYVGADVEDDDVYAGMFGGAEARELVSAAVQGLLSMMISPEIRRRLEAGEGLPKPVIAKGETAPGKQRASAGPSKPSSKRR